ncbi:MAG: hypothetical protein AB7Q81_17560 [Gammaproteobacteria bacterium]
MLIALPSTALAGAATTSYEDPFAYCATVHDADAPAPPYRGPALPPAVIDALSGPAELAVVSVKLCKRVFMAEVRVMGLKRPAARAPFSAL